jgi:SAM-dependent methyltransferase
VSVEARWDDEYRRGRYAGEPPVAFVGDIVEHARGARGLYVGCGNGRNFVPLVEAGLDLVGLDVSADALDQLRARLPGAQLVHGDLSAIGERFEVVIGIQVFQHSDTAATHAHIRTALGKLEPGGLFCLRVNADGTQIEHAHTWVEPRTLRYDAGPKRGLLVHFFTHAELSELMRGCEPVLPLRIARTHRVDGTHWDQWEGIWRCA